MARRRRRDDRLSPTESRKHLLRERRSRRDRQMLLAVLGPVLAVILLMLGYGAFRELYQIPSSPVARVNGETITGGTYRARLQWERRQLLNNLQNLLPMLSSNDPSIASQIAGQQRDSLPQTTLDLLIDEALIRQEAEKRGIEVTEADLDAKVNDDLLKIVAPQGTATPVLTTTASVTTTLAEAEPADDAPLGAAGALTGTEGVTTTAAVTATATAIPTDAIGEAYETYVEPALSQTGLSLSQYRDLVVRPQVYRQKLGDLLGKEVPITDKQVEVAYLLFNSDATAQEAADALAAGEAWEDVVARYRPPATPEPEVPAEATPEALAPGAEITGTAGTPVTATGATTATGAVEVGGEATATAGARATATARATGTASPTLAATATEAPTGAAPTAAVTATTALTPTALPSPTPPPSPTPEPFAAEAGEREWMTRQSIVDRWSLSEADADTLMGLAAGTSSAPLESSRGRFIVHVFAVDEARALPATELEARKTGALDKWLEEAKKTAKIDRFPTEGFVPPEPAWFTDYYNRLVGAPQPTLDVPGLSVSTTAPGAPPAAGTAAP